VKVLMCAYACRPNRGSEPGVGWNWVRQAAKSNEVWALTRTCNRHVIERELEQRPIPNLHFVYYDIPGWSGFQKQYPRSPRLYFLLWQLSAVPLCRRLHRRIGFDVAHHVTFVTFDYPSCLAWLKCPFIWGPVGGGEKAPLAFYPTFRLGAIIHELKRDAVKLAMPFNPFVLWTMVKAKRIIATTKETHRALPPWAQAKTIVARAEGIELEGEPVTRDGSPSDHGLRVLYVGRLVHWKGVHLAIQAFAQFLKGNPDAHFTMHMDGPERPRLEKLAADLGLDSEIEFDITGTYAEVLRMYDRHDVLLFPSLRDTGGFAVVEAMSRGLPVICLDRGGPADSVTDDVGIKVPARNPPQTIHDLAAALQHLSADPQLRARMSEAGRQRVADVFQWNGMSILLRELYDSVVSEVGSDSKGARSQP